MNIDYDSALNDREDFTLTDSRPVSIHEINESQSSMDSPSRISHVRYISPESRGAYDVSSSAVVQGSGGKIVSNSPATITGVANSGGSNLIS